MRYLVDVSKGKFIIETVESGRKPTHTNVGIRGVMVYLLKCSLIFTYVGSKLKLWSLVL